MRLPKSRVFATVLIFALVAGIFAHRALPSHAQTGPDLTEFTSGNVRFVYPTALATSITETPVEAVPYTTTDMPLWAANPAYTTYTFDDASVDPNVYHAFPVISIYPTADFEAFTDRTSDFPYGYGLEVDALKALLTEQPDLATFTEIASAGSPDVATLPFVPPANAAQVFRSHAEYIAFDDGWGVRYLTYYSQAVNPMLEGDVFYTFQGISNDGSTYISVRFPIVTGLLPTEMAADFDYDAFANDYMNFLNNTLAALNAQDGELFTPTLSTLDSIMLSLSINGTIDLPAPEATPEASGG